MSQVKHMQRVTPTAQSTVSFPANCKANFCTLFVAPAPARVTEATRQEASNFAGQLTEQMERNVAMQFFGGEQKPPPPKEKPVSEQIGNTVKALIVPGTFVAIWAGIAYMGANGGN